MYLSTAVNINTVTFVFYFAFVKNVFVKSVRRARAKIKGTNK